MLDDNRVSWDRAFEKLKGRVMRAGQFIDADSDVFQIARLLDLIVEGDDCLCCNGWSEAEHLTAARALF